MLSRLTSDTIELPHRNDRIDPILQKLLTLHSENRRIVSAYLRFEVRDRDRRAYLIALKDEIRLLQADPEFPALAYAAREEVQRDLNRILGFAEHAAGSWATHGIGVFAWEERGLFEAVGLSEVARTRVALDRIPQVRELAAARAAARPVLTVLADRTHVRLFEVSDGAAAELPSLFSPATREGRFHGLRLDAPGWGERDYHGRMNEERRLQSARIASALEPLTAAEAPQGILLAGPVEYTAMLAADLPRELAERIIGRVPLNPTIATVAEVKGVTLHAAETWRRQATSRVVRAIEEGIGKGLAVEGTRETVLALSKGQVRTLVVPEQRGGNGDPLDDIVEDALRHGIDVVLVHEPGMTELRDGVGALLRYR